ncbi:endonuclease/exonuclease/phosphatase family protein [Rhizobium sp. C1]|uniref:endonuclease/exonuclease/phosphatase family protein n=1 Tax=Rhizobium sp. C1 TaxID=1349799 RepID=UPI001E65D790|nr:endonuclease/exonuclease/phosphatase family protein [Rhizobium sp. C1]MCD2176559.1 endonuclease/exonuclease/phosphatase family protein [Rhizobium sp. C1]
MRDPLTKTHRNLAEVLVSTIRRKRTDASVRHAFGEAEDKLVVASYNVHKCVGTDGKFDPGRIMDVIREIGPDVIALQEADMRFGERAGLLDLNRLRLETGLVAVPMKTVSKSHGWRGNVILVRKGALRDVHEVALPGLEPRGALVAELELENGAGLRIIAAHLGLLRRSRQQQAEFLLDLMSRRGDSPTLLMGDFNEWRLGKRSALKHFEAVVGPLPPALPSFPARMPVLSLDRIIGNRKGMIADIAVHDTPLARLASDHLPLAAVIDLDAVAT